MTRGINTYWAITLIIISFLSTNVNAQHRKADLDAWRFHSYMAPGILTGEIGPAFQCQTVNGMGNRSWFSGIGIGIDYYRFRSVPFFLDIKKTFIWNSFGLFAYADAGIDFPWATPRQHSADQSNFSNGFYGDFGLGLLIPQGRRVSVFFSFGYSIKEAKEAYTSFNSCPLIGACIPNNQIVFYELNRFSIKAGISF